ncbi:uncharacterized protein LOC142004070 [Carettochelys insculpta]|uniref:uncharacterized protein LOC142004070 n=1 Tax=Carettochelys insculpta TaxID=44489 RepID=UPI003EBB4CA8
MMKLHPRWLILLVTLWTLSRIAGTQSAITAQDGKNVTLNCTFFSIPGIKFQRLNITWIKERDKGPALLVHKYYWGMDQLYKQDKDYKGRTQLFPKKFPKGNASLSLCHVRMEDEGSYGCYVSSELRSISGRILLSVIRETEVEETISAHLGEDITLNCSFGPVANHQSLNITWKKAPDLLVHSYFSQLDQLEKQDEAYRGRTQLYPERFHEGNASLKLKKVHLTDEGLYTCHVKPKLGHFSMRMHLTVEKAPDQTHSPQLWLLLLCVLIVPLAYIFLKCGLPSLQQSVKHLHMARASDASQSVRDSPPQLSLGASLQEPAGNESPRSANPELIQGSTEAGDHDKGAQNPREEDWLLGPTQQLLSPDGHCADLPEDGNEGLMAAFETGGLSDSAFGSQESHPSLMRNIALLGETGCGKSSFINTIRGLDDEHEDAAQTGVINTTTEKSSYQHRNVILWDTPGMMLEKFSLHRDMDLSQCDMFLIFSSNNFTPFHANLAREIQGMGKKVYFVRSKVDDDLYNNTRKKDFSESKILEQIQSTCTEFLKEENLNGLPLFLLSCNENSQHDFPHLEKYLGLEQRLRYDFLLKQKNALDGGILKAVVRAGGSRTDMASAASSPSTHSENAELNIAVIGELGSGRSSFINAIRDLDDEDKSAATTGLAEVTAKPTPFTFPTHPNVTLWELPPIGTPTFQAGSYLQVVNFGRYDLFIVIASGRFRLSHVTLAREIQRMEKKCYFVRSKVDTDLQAAARRRPSSYNEESILQEIREYCRKTLEEEGVKNPQIFLISNWYLTKYDFHLLQETLVSELSRDKKHALLLALPNYSEEIIQEKKEALKQGICWVAGAACIGALVPIPGVSVFCNVAVLVKYMRAYSRNFGLDRESFTRLARRSHTTTQDLEKAIIKTRLAEEINHAFVIALVASFALVLASSYFVWVPVIGIAVNAGISYIASYRALDSFLESAAEDAKNVQRTAWKPGTVGQEREASSKKVN